MFTIIIDGTRQDIPIANVKRIVWEGHMPHIEMLGGERISIDHDDFARLIDQETVGTFGALDSTFLLSYYVDDEGEIINRLQVAGWRQTGEGKLKPLVLQFGAAEDEGYYIQFPDGRVESLDGEVWRSYDDWLIAQRPSTSSV